MTSLLNNRCLLAVVVQLTALCHGAWAQTPGELVRGVEVPLQSGDSRIGVVKVPSGERVWILESSGGRVLAETQAGAVWVAAGLVRPTKERPRFKAGSRVAPSQKVVQGPARIVIRVPSRQTSTSSPEMEAAFPTGRENLPPKNRAAEQRVLELVNAERSAHGLAPLVWDEDLARAARFHAAHMQVNGYFDHRTRVGRRSLPPEERIMLFSDSVRGENIGRGYRSAEDAMVAWMNSPGHRENVLDPEARYLGVGVWGRVWVQNFG